MKKTKELRKAVFLDRDGTIIEDNGYIDDPSQVVFFEHSISALQKIADFFDLFIVTNQSGVAKGVITFADVERINSYIESILNKNGICVVETYVCPHQRSDNCRCIKPNPYFLLEASKNYSIDFSRSFVVGDHPHDVEFAKNVGATGIYVLSGHGMKHRKEISPDTIMAYDIREAAEIILEHMNNKKGKIVYKKEE